MCSGSTYRRWLPQWIGRCGNGSKSRTWFSPMCLPRWCSSISLPRCATTSSSAMACCGACSGARALNVGAASLAGGRVLATTFGCSCPCPLQRRRFLLRPTLLREIAAIDARVADRRFEELLRQHVGLRRLRAARRAGELDPLLSIRDFDRAEAHQLLTGGADPNGRRRRWIRLARTGHDRCYAG